MQPLPETFYLKACGTWLLLLRIARRRPRPLDVEEADAGVLDTRCPRVCEASEDAVSNSLQLCLKCSWQAYARSGGRQHMRCCAAITQGWVLVRFPVEVQLGDIAGHVSLFPRLIHEHSQALNQCSLQNAAPDATRV